MIALSKREVDWENGSSREWVHANGLGGYASSSVTCANTRKYHGLLVAANAPGDRRLLVSKLEEKVAFEGAEFELSANEWRDRAVKPQGFRFMESFSLSPLPTFVFSLPEFTVKKTVFCVHGENTSCVAFEFESKKPFEFTARPLLNDRSVHSNTHGSLVYSQEPKKNASEISFPTGSTLFVSSDAASFTQDAHTYWGMFYKAEAERALDPFEDHVSPGFFSFKARAGSSRVAFVFSTQKKKVDAWKEMEQASKRALELQKTFYKSTGLQKSVLADCLCLAADSFIVERGEFKSVMAGYHWFQDWGRDALISLEGLALCTGRPKAARSVLELFMKNVSNGLTPNYFDETGKPHYNSVDASLWLVHAGSVYLKKSNDDSFVRPFLSTLKSIVSAYSKGTDNDVREEGGLICAGNEVTNLTWMDAKAGGVAATPRFGKPVEINALWYNTLKVGEEVAKRAGDKEFARKAKSKAALTRKSFQRFWNGEFLSDTLDPVRNEIRPNQLLAVAIPFSLITKRKEKVVLSVVERELLSPCGLRTLSRKDKSFIGTYSGDMRSRDASYHNGAVWPWLFGVYCDALKKTGGDIPEKMFEPFERHLKERGIGTVSELFEADSNRPDGCVSQAWSVAEVLRAYSLK